MQIFRNLDKQNGDCAVSKDSERNALKEPFHIAELVHVDSKNDQNRDGNPYSDQTVYGWICVWVVVSGG